MEHIPDPLAGNLVLIVASARITRGILTNITVRLALNGPVAVFDGGNCFNAYKVARAIRRQTGDLENMLKRIQYARAFTCYQMLALLAQSPAASFPTVVPGFLTTFYDENVDVSEAQRLLQESILHLRRLSQDAAVVAFADPPAGRPERIVLLERLQEAVENVYVCQPRDQNLQDRLF